MSRFTEKLIISLEKDGKQWRLEEDFEYYTLLFGNKEYIRVEKGFLTDFASIPKIFIPVLKWRDKFNKAAVVHDWLYNTKQYPRKISDRIFLEGMEVIGISKTKRYVFYYIVRLFGWYRWYRINDKLKNIINLIIKSKTNR